MRSFEDWWRAPMPERSSDPRVNVRRLRPDEFELVFDVVDAAFGVARPRAEYDWLYRRNPLGLARCIAGFDRVSGRIVCTSADYPWPIARGASGVPGAINGDMAIVPDWQRRRLFGVLDDFRAQHAWRGETVRLAWPNARSRRALVRRGETHTLAGALRRAWLPLDARRWLTRVGVPARLGAPLGRALSASLAAWRRMRGPADERFVVEQPRRFEADADALVARAHADWPGYWSPHGAEFLNWRFLAHPQRTYVPLSARRGEELVAIGVVRLDGARALLMELVGEPAEPAAAALLLRRALALAREAGHDALELLAAPRWPHWRLLRGLAAFERPSQSVLQILDADSDEARTLDHWRLSGGDLDADG